MKYIFFIEESNKTRLFLNLVYHPDNQMELYSRDQRLSTSPEIKHILGVRQFKTT